MLTTQQNLTAVLAILLQCPEETVRERYLGRTDVTRPTGDEALFRLRMNNYVNESPAIEEIYQQKGVLLKVGSMFVSVSEPRTIALTRRSGGCVCKLR